MNIHSAAILIGQGCIMRRKAWSLYEGPWDGLRKHRGNLAGRVGLSLEDLLADDWLVAASPEDAQEPEHDTLPTDMCKWCGMPFMDHVGTIYHCSNSSGATFAASARIGAV